MLPVINIGPAALPLSPLVLLLGLWLGLEISEKQAPRFGVEAGKIYTLVLVAILAGVAGARLVYASLAPQAFLANPLNLFSPRPELFNAAGGLAAAALAGLIYARRRGMPVWSTLDALTGLLAVLGAALGLSHMASGDAFGAPASLPWVIELWGARRHPSQGYETLAALLILAATWPRAGRFLNSPGLRFWVFTALTAGSRVFLEAFRGDSVLLGGGLRLAQLVALGVLGLSLWQIGRRITLAGMVEGETA